MEAAGEVRRTAADALSNLVTVLELVADGRVRCDPATRRPAAATIRLVDDALVAGDFYDDGPPLAAYAWPVLVQAGGLARLAGQELELTAAGARALDRPGYQTLGEVWSRWLRSVAHDELSRVEVIKGQRRPGTLTSVVKRRAAVARALAAMAPGSWADTELVLSVLRTDEVALTAVCSLRALWKLHIGDSYYGSLGHAGAKAWDVVEGRYALCVLFEYVATMGLIDVRYSDPRGARDDYRFLWGAEDLPFLSRYDGLRAIRVNELGAAILHDRGSLRHIGLPKPPR